MSESESAKKVKRMFRGLGAPPPPGAAVGNLSLPAPAVREKSDRTEQLNLRVPPEIRKRVRVLAARDGISLSEVIIRAVELYEERHGKVPEL